MAEDRAWLILRGRSGAKSGERSPLPVLVVPSLFWHSCAHPLGTANKQGTARAVLLFL